MTGDTQSAPWRCRLCSAKPPAPALDLVILHTRSSGGPKMEEKENTGPWGSTRNSLIPRPWIQDIEGANAKELCNVSSAKARSIVPGKMPWKR